MDGGKTWLDRFERDANVVILGSMGISPTIPEFLPIPTPEPWFQSLTP
jgi:hypothetical protein